MTNSSDDFDLDLPPPESSSEEFELDLPPPEPSLVLNLLKKNIGEVKQHKRVPEPEPAPAPVPEPKLEKEPEIKIEKQEVQAPQKTEAKKTPPKKRIGFLRLTLDFVGLVILLIAAAGTLIELYLPREELRILAQKQLTKTLNIPVSIGRLNFSFLRGLELSQLNVGKGGSFFYAKSVVLDYDLTKLLRGKFILNEAAIDYPDIKLISQNGIWNFQPLLELGKAQKKQAPPSKGSAGLPPIPIAAVLNELRVKNLRLLLNQDNDLVARLNGLSVKATGNFNLDKIRADLSVSIDAPKDQPNLEFRQFSSETEVAKDLT